MSEYIERKAVIDAFRTYMVAHFDKEKCVSTENCDDCERKCLWNKVIINTPSADVAPVVHGRWIDGVCSNCKEEAISRSWDEPIYDYDWEENLRYSYTETHTEYQLTDYCPNCGAKMDLEE